LPATSQNVDVHECRHCSKTVEDSFRFCPWCATPQRTKLVQFFAPHPDLPDEQAKALRVSRYLGSRDQEPQVRFSIWEADAVRAAISLAEDEATRVAAFVAPTGPSRGALMDQVRAAFRL
jgi:hypothetical protein